MVWGFGEKTFSFLSNINIKYLGKIKAIVDTDKHKHDFFFPGSKIKVISPREAKKIKPKLIMLLSVGHKSEILEYIFKHIKSCDNIITISEDSKKIIFLKKRKKKWIA